MDTARLLNDLCAGLGFCLEPEDQQRLIESPPPSVDAFTDEVMRAEGLDPLTSSSEMRAQVRAMVAEHMGERPWPLRRSR